MNYSDSLLIPQNCPWPAALRAVRRRVLVSEGLTTTYDRAGMMLVEMLLDDLEIARVRAEEKVEGIADERDRAERGVDAQIADHPPDLPLRHPQVARLPDQIGAHRRGDDVTDDGDQPDDRVEAYGAVDTGNDEAAFEKDFEHLDALAQRRGVGPVLDQRVKDRVGVGRRRGHRGPFKSAPRQAPLY